MDLLKNHKSATKECVKLIAKREKLYNEVIQIIPTFQTQDTDVKRAKFLDLLEKYRSVTLRIIENIVQWREQLWRPLPFYYKNKNYIFTIVKESEYFKNEASKKLFRKLHTSFINYVLLIPKVSSRYMGISSDIMTRYESAVKVIELEGQLQEYLRKESLVNARDGVYLPVLKWKPYCHAETPETEELNSEVNSPSQKIELLKCEKSLPPANTPYYITVYEVVDPDNHSLLIQAYNSFDAIILTYRQPLDLKQGILFI